MGSITSLKCALTQEHLDAICVKYFVPEEVHPQLPSPDSTMHKRPAGKVGMYTRFFDYANYQMDLNAFIRIPDPRKVRIVERARAENERLIVTVAKHRTMTLLPTLVVRSSRELSASVEREFIRDASVGDGVDQGFDSVGGQDNVEPTVPVTEHVETKIPGPKRSKKKRVTRGGEGTPGASHPPKRLRADYGTTGGSATGGKSPSVLNSFTFGGGEDLTDSCAKSADPEVDSLVRSAPHPSVFGSFSSSEKTDRTLSLFTGRSGSGFAAGSIRAEEYVGAGLEEIYVPEWTVTKGFELNDGHSCANMIDHFTPPAFFKTATEGVMEVSQLRAPGYPFHRGLREFNFGRKHSSTKEHNVSVSKNSQNQSLVNQVHELETSSTDLREKLEMYEGSLKQWLLTHGMKLLVVKCLNSTEYMEALGHAFGRAIEKGMQEGLAAGMTDLQPDASQLMVPVHHKQDRVIIGSQALSVALDICRGRVKKMERNLFECLPLLKDVFVSLDHPLSTKVLIELLCGLLYQCSITVVIVPHPVPSVPSRIMRILLSGCGSKELAFGVPEGEEQIDASAGSDLHFPSWMMKLGMLFCSCICFSPFGPPVTLRFLL
ncbi:hypothetical protein Tco_0701293 [Tanacetum coccineum]